MNEFFGRHAVITLTLSDNFVILQTLDALNGRSMRMYIDAGKLYRWIDSDAQGAFIDYDCGSFTLIRRESCETVHVHQTWIQSSIRNTVRGYTQDFTLAIDDLLAVLVAGIDIRQLVSLDGKPMQACITITDGVHRRIGRMNKLQRRALSKALRDGFRWKDSHICLYTDWNDDFAFVEQRMSGGLCLHKTRVIGEDSKPHDKLSYQVHT